MTWIGQCVFNRSGILCGGCKPGLSLTLGRPLCQHCSNRYVALLAAFAGTGVALVILHITCNITVTEGTVNGLIFYTNIVRVNHTIFFPHYDSNILTIFIAWINLYLGIQSCFYNGMDGYTLTWLQFVFPIYIWTIIIFIILLGRRYHIAMSLLQDKYRFWTGFLLLVRNILYLVFAFNTLDEPSVSLLVIILTSLSLSVLLGVFHAVYNKRYCNILEFSFYLNLGTVSAATLYVWIRSRNHCFKFLSLNVRKAAIMVN